MNCSFNCYGTYSYLSRLMFPLCYNFLYVAKEKQGTAFSTIMGDINLFPLMGEAVNLYLPFAIILLCGVTYFNAYDRLLRSLSVREFTYDATDQDANDSTIQESRSLLSQGVAASQESTQFYLARRAVEPISNGNGGHRSVPLLSEESPRFRGHQQFNLGLSRNSSGYTQVALENVWDTPPQGKSKFNA